MTKPPRDLTRPEFQAQMTDEQLRHSIRIGKGQMPAFGGLMPNDDIADVIAFIRTLVPPGSVPAPQVAPQVAPTAATSPASQLAPAAPEAVPSASQAAALAPPADVAAGGVVR